jgi:RNA polymerase sigma-70 factor (ECF subfamily)
MTEHDHELLNAVLAGSTEAFAAFYRQRQGAIFRFAFQMTGSVEVAEDVTQETFLALLSAAKRYDASRGPISAFLYGIARNQVFRRIGGRKHEPLEEQAGGADVLDDLTRRETVDRVRRAVLSLPPAYREVVVLCDLGEASYEEAAAALDCPIGTVRSRLNRARAILAQKLGAVRGVCNV